MTKNGKGSLVDSVIFGSKKTMLMLCNSIDK